MRWVRLFITALMLGFATTVVVAWSLAAWLPPSSWSHLEVAVRYEEVSIRGNPGAIGAKTVATLKVVSLRAYRASTPGACRQWWERYQGPWRGHVAFRNAINGATSGEIVEVPSLDGWGTVGQAFATSGTRAGDKCEHATGWPWLCGWYEITSARGGNGYDVTGGIALPVRVSATPSVEAWQVRALPLRPMWRGILRCTSAYAASWFGVLVCAGVYRRWRRRRSGRCAGCAYDMTGLRTGCPCPECGAA